MKDQLTESDVLPRLPNYFDPQKGTPLPSDFVGANIVRAGTFPHPIGIEGGGLVIDYQPDSSRLVRRLVLAFNDCGMWVHRLILTTTAVAE
jgi:hypothetical protein